MEIEVFIPDVIQSVVSAMRVPVYPATNPVTYYTINYQPGRHIQIIDALKSLSGGSLDSLKYPLIAVVMPIPEDSGSGFLEVTFREIVIAYLTKTGTNSEKVMDKYSSDGVFKNILKPCLREFIKNLAFSTFTNMGDPDAYEFTFEENPSQQPIGQGMTDYVDIIKILNLKATIFSKIITC